MTRSSAFSALLVMALLCSAGCVSEPTPLSVVHSHLGNPATQREGALLVRPLEDARLQQLRRFIGSSGRERPGSPPSWETALMLEGDEKLGPLLAGYVAYALRQAGYAAVVESATSSASKGDGSPDGVVKGRIEVFWLNREGPVSWHSIALTLKLLDRSSDQTRWKGSFEALHSSTDFFPERSDYESLIRDALDEVLNDMVAAFASSDFHSAVREAR